MSLAPFVRVLGRGPGRSRSLTRDEADAAMRIMLSGRANPQAVGALLMLMRMKGETACEIAGFAGAAQSNITGMPAIDLDWPSYAAGRTRGLPWFLLAARLVSRAGHRVLLHGWNGPDAAVRKGVSEIGIPLVETPQDAARALDRDNIAYYPLEALSPALFDLLKLRDVLGLRSCINTVSRMLNPGGAIAGVQGVFHPSYRLLQADAAQALGWISLSVIKGGGGEFERHPGKPVTAFGLRDGRSWQNTLLAQTDDARRLADGPAEAGALKGLWDGTFHDDFAQAIVIGTAALAFETVGEADPHKLAEELWTTRQTALAA